MGAVDTWLTAEEVERLTDRVQPAAQCRQLAKMGVEFTPSATGKPLVARARYAPDTMTAPPKQRKGPNWSAMRGKAA